ncbi:hypothetical protein F383_15665 [Gossypium arboreum]|uniref:Uncharacterized protein n=1 Tax=Gossypium arboreum TaxID=29729 RepID=A0A0B0NB78_GOSAR|nr:hypothetical protein F383_15665 [Gossypium arboreum]
MLVLFSLFLL